MAWTNRPEWFNGRPLSPPPPSARELLPEYVEREGPLPIYLGLVAVGVMAVAAIFLSWFA